MYKVILVLAFSMFTVFTGYAQEIITDFDEGSLPVLNEELRKTNSSINKTNAAVTANLASALTYTDGGDDAAYDFVKTDLTIDGTWNDLDLSSIVGTGTRLVLLHLTWAHNTAQIQMLFRTNGNSNTKNVAREITSVVNQNEAGDIWVTTDSSGIIEYNIASTGAFANLDISIGGFFKA